MGQQLDTEPDSKNPRWMLWQCSGSLLGGGRGDGLGGLQDGGARKVDSAEQETRLGHGLGRRMGHHLACCMGCGWVVEGPHMTGMNLTDIWGPDISGLALSDDPSHQGAVSNLGLTMTRLICCGAMHGNAGWTRGYSRQQWGCCRGSVLAVPW